MEPGNCPLTYLIETAKGFGVRPRLERQDGSVLAPLFQAEPNPCCCKNVGVFLPKI